TKLSKASVQHLQQLMGLIPSSDLFILMAKRRGKPGSSSKMLSSKHVLMTRYGSGPWILRLGIYKTGVNTEDLWAGTGGLGFKIPRQVTTKSYSERPRLA